MNVVVEAANSTVAGVMESIGKDDARIVDWPLMRSPWPTLGLACAYLLIVRNGPKMMKHREPFKLTWALILFNVIMVALNAYIVLAIAIGYNKLNYDFYCQEVGTSNDYWSMTVAGAAWWYYFSKILEFGDTFFFILRKKNNQMSFLHVYHHVSMACLWWIGARYFPGGTPVAYAAINAFVHVVMYSYYGLAAAANYFPGIVQFLWWKKHLTKMQLTQFVFVIAHAANLLRSNCGFPKWMLWMHCGYVVSHVCLFTNFYIRSYLRGQKKKAKETTDANRNIVSGEVFQNCNGTSITYKDNEENSARNRLRPIVEETSRKIA